jgi:glucose-6-phosphate isomerase
MAVTASRLGNSPITLDWSHIQRKHDPDFEVLAATWNQLKTRFHAGDVGFYDSPLQNEISQITESQALAESILQKKEFTDCLFLGIGGSALGPISLLSSLVEKQTSGIRFHFVENPDPLEWKTTVARLRPETTLVCSVTKSGTTFETMAQTLLALEWIGKSRWKTHFVAITDPSKGDLRSFAQQYEIPSLSIAPSMGGRFSIFSPVGLFPAALAGLSPQAILLGAKQVRDYMEKAPVEKNAIFNLASELIRHYPKRMIHVCMPYSTRLRLLGTWFVQLWGESLGKDGKGFTPVAAVGSTDQHSILQLLRDGPDDKVTFFMKVDQVDDEVKIPNGPLTPDRKGYSAFKILEGHSLHDLLNIEYRATSLVLTKQGRPHVTIGIDQLDERSMGALYFTYSVLTAFTGALWGVNPFDQPGVEEGKVYIRQSLSEERATSALDENSAVARLRRETTL